MVMLSQCKQSIARYVAWFALKMLYRVSLGKSQAPAAFLVLPAVYSEKSSSLVAHLKQTENIPPSFLLSRHGK